MHLKLFNAEAETAFLQQSYALPGEEEYQQQSPMTRGSLIMLAGMMETISSFTEGVKATRRMFVLCGILSIKIYNSKKSISIYTYISENSAKLAITL